MNKASFEEIQLLNNNIRSLEADIDTITEVLQNPENLRALVFEMNSCRQLRITSKYAAGEVIFAPTSETLTTILRELNKQHQQRLKELKAEFRAL